MGFNGILSFLLVFGNLFGFIVVLAVIRNSKSLNKDIFWVVLILLFPFIGSLLYFVLESGVIKCGLLEDISNSIEKSKKYFICDNTIEQEALKKGNNAIEYLSKYCKFPITKRNRVTYYSSGEIFFKNVKLELKEAKKFIFIEFFSIGTGALWEEVLEILVEKVQAGIDVRLIYDNVACKKKIPSNYYRKLESLGIKCEPYFKGSSLIGMIKNHRDHRKCVIVDGRIAFTGGMNIEDRYVNLEQPYGYWKDVGISVQGDGVWNFMIMFLSMWNALCKVEEDYSKYCDSSLNGADNFGYVVSFGDNPLDEENVGKNVYISMIQQARRSLYIFTPYLILDMDIYNALALAAKRGVDVKIVIPGIPDKKSVYLISLLNAKKLFKEGVKVYTYTPGFMHGKVFLVDDEMAVVGSVNTDYRSLYLDFEYGVFVQGLDVIRDIKQDIEDTLQKSDEIKSMKTNFFQFLVEAIILLFSPIM